MYGKDFKLKNNLRDRREKIKFMKKKKLIKILEKIPGNPKVVLLDWMKNAANRYQPNNEKSIHIEKFEVDYYGHGEFVGETKKNALIYISFENNDYIDKWRNPTPPILPTFDKKPLQEDTPQRDYAINPESNHNSEPVGFFINKFPIERLMLLRYDLPFIQELIETIFVPAKTYKIQNLKYKKPIEEYELLRFYFDCVDESLHFVISKKLDFYTQCAKSDMFFTNHNTLLFYEKLTNKLLKIND